MLEFVNHFLVPKAGRQGSLPDCTMRANRILIEDHDKISSKAGIKGVPETKMPPVSLSKFAFSALDNEANGVEELFPNEKTTNGAWRVNTVVPEHAGVSGGQIINKSGAAAPPN